MNEAWILGVGFAAIMYVAVVMYAYKRKKTQQRVVKEQQEWCEEEKPKI
ncbi:MAG: hypothetical protein ACREBU_00095 [Nitrososphaera sp.]